MNIELKEIAELVDRINEINKLDLNDTVITRNGVVIDASEYHTSIAEWKYIGLNNLDFLKDFLGA